MDVQDIQDKFLPAILSILSIHVTTFPFVPFVYFVVKTAPRWVAFACPWLVAIPHHEKHEIHEGCTAVSCLQQENGGPLGNRQLCWSKDSLAGQAIVSFVCFVVFVVHIANG